MTRNESSTNLPTRGERIVHEVGVLHVDDRVLGMCGSERFDPRHRLLEHRGPVLGHDLVAMAAPLTKWSVQVERADEFALIMHRALKIEPRHFNAWTGLGHILMASDEKALAMRAYRRVLTINPQMSDVKTIVDRLSPEVDGQDL